MERLDKIEYRKIIWELLEDYRDDEDMTLEELLESIMAIPIPKETKNPYVALSTREDGVYH
ncbi:hypothetical protein ES708_26481 [subsurface metagenome]